jgi:hypothetical protein
MRPLDPASNHIMVHRLQTGHGRDAGRLALTVMAPGGRAIIPQEVYGPHPEFLLPARPLVLWRYTDMGDPRFTWGRRFIQLRQDRKSTAPLKLGALNTLGWAAHENGGRLFVNGLPAAAAHVSRSAAIAGSSPTATCWRSTSPVVALDQRVN